MLEFSLSVRSLVTAPVIMETQYSNVPLARPSITTPTWMHRADNFSHPRQTLVYNLRISHLELPSTCESHNILRIILFLDLMKPLKVITIHRLQWRPKQRVVDIRCCILQVLPVLDPGLDQRRMRKTHSFCHEPVGRCVSPTEVDTGWEDRERAVWWVRGWPAMGEVIGLKWVKAIN